MSKAERDALTDAIVNGRNRREEIVAEWEKLGLAPRIQSPAEMRRVLMTWSKAQLVEFVIRAESDEIKAREKQLRAWDDANRLREYALVLPRQSKTHEMGYADPFNAWLLNHTGQTLAARDIFTAGWSARVRTEAALSEEP